MQNNTGANGLCQKSRQLVLAENYRTQPNFSSLAQVSIFDAPKEVLLQKKQTVSVQEETEIQNSVHAALLKFTT